MSLNDSIKKYSLKHVSCTQGGLHTGEVMNLVCVDSTCSHRGLICPICRMQHHESHQILPIKTFLENIRSLFTQSDNNEELNNLSDYLRALENSKKQIIGNLRDEVARLAKYFKSLEEKIEENFASIRRNVLIQSSITTKLPTLLTLLTEQNVNKDSESIREQFKKYTELLKYQNEKLKVSDKAKALVQTYSAIPSKLSGLLQKHTDDYTQSISSLPNLFDQKQKGTVADSANLYTFSTENKYFDIVLEQNNKLVKISQESQESGFIFVNENKGAKKQKIILEIVSNMTDSISVGLGDVDQFRNQCSFINDGTMDQKPQSYQFVYSGDCKKLFNPDQEDSDQQESIGIPFITGDIIEVEYDGTSLNYFNRMSLEKYTATPKFSEKAKENLQFVVGLSQGDSVRIIDQ